MPNHKLSKNFYLANVRSLQTNIKIHKHTQEFASQSHITGRLVSALNVGLHQAIVQEHENAYRKSMHSEVGDLTLLF